MMRHGYSHGSSTMTTLRIPLSLFIALFISSVFILTNLMYDTDHLFINNAGLTLYRPIECPDYGEDINFFHYMASTNKSQCKREYDQFTKYYPYYVAEVKHSSNNTFTQYYLEYCNPYQTNWMTSASLVSSRLVLTILYMTNDIIDIKIHDELSQQWEIPNEEPYPRFLHGPKSNKESSLFEVKVVNMPFSLEIIRKSTQQAVFNTTGLEFVYSHRYIQIGTHLTTPNIYGLGERVSNFNLASNATYTIFNKDQAWTIDDGKPGNNLYGSHPVYLQRESKANDYSVVYLRNSNAMDAILTNGERLTFKIVGGIIDLIIFLGDNYPETAIEKYHDYIGGWKLFPFWSHGYHQSRWGYQSSLELLKIIEKFDQENIPIDAIWNDIDYMENYRDFTVNKTYKNKHIREIQKRGRRYVPILDAGVAIIDIPQEDMVVHEKADSPDVNVKIEEEEVVIVLDDKSMDDIEVHISRLETTIHIQNGNGEMITGWVWPGKVYFPDFHNPNASLWWNLSLERLYYRLSYDGIWIDMNEISNFCDGICHKKYIKPFYSPNKVEIPNCHDHFDQIPYNPGYLDLNSRTLNMDSMHYSHKNILYEYDVHNHFGLLQSKITHESLLNLSDLTFVLSRSTVPGSNKYVSHWLGDNESTWEWLRNSIAGIFSFNLFGIPMTGADICGFHGNTNDELCVRWMQLGAFYPFSRNHNHLGQIPQEPYHFSESIRNIHRNSLRLRYSLLKYYYSLFIMKKGRGTIFRPVFFEFPNDEVLLNINNPYTDEQFLLGSGIMITPIVEPSVLYVDVYFPQDDWYDYITGARVHSKDQQGSTMRLYVPLEVIPIFIRGGHIIHRQNASGVRSTEDLNSEFELVVAFNGTQTSKQAKGQIMALHDFNDTSIVERCLLGECLAIIEAQYEGDELSQEIRIALTKVKDNDAQVKGSEAQATGDDAHANGGDAQAKGDDAQAKDDDIQAKGDDTQAKGDDTQAKAKKRRMDPIGLYSLRFYGLDNVKLDENMTITVSGREDKGERDARMIEYEVQVKIDYAVVSLKEVVKVEIGQQILIKIK